MHMLGRCDMFWIHKKAEGKRCHRKWYIEYITVKKEETFKFRQLSFQFTRIKVRWKSRVMLRDSLEVNLRCDIKEERIYLICYHNLAFLLIPHHT